MVRRQALEQAGEHVARPHFHEQRARMRGRHGLHDLDPAHGAGQLREQEGACLGGCGDRSGRDVRIDGPVRDGEVRGIECRLQALRGRLHQR